jgi:hypothetical protein
MSDFTTFLALGFRHITAPSALDHLLFLVALVAPYRLRDWRHLLGVASAFTVGHSITLALVVTGVAHLPTAVIEFLIPVTIVLTGIENLVLRERAAMGRAARHRPVFAGVFGLVHGAGFANYLRSLFVDRIALPLLGFNLGIEAAQIVVLSACVALLAAVDWSLKTMSRDGVRLRVIAVSCVVGLVATRWALERAPW